MKQMPLVTADNLFQAGYWFLREGKLYEITTWDAKSPMVVEARADQTNVVEQFTLTELFASQPVTRFAGSKMELEANSDLETKPLAADGATLPAHLLARADHIIQTVEAVKEQIERLQRQYRQTGKHVTLANITQQACQSLPKPISRSQYYTYRHLYQTYEGNRGLIAFSLRRKSYAKTNVSHNSQHFIDTIIRRFYRSNPPLRPRTVYHIAQQLWQHNRHWWLNAEQMTGEQTEALLDHLLDARQNIDDLLSNPETAPYLVQIQLPSQSWFYNYVNWFTTQPGEGAQVYIARQGKADWEENFLLFDRFAQTATLPLQYVFADHYLLDVLHVDDEFREVLGRLWLTLLIDTYSRAVLGLFLGYEAPCIESIQGALRHAIWPKSDLSVWGVDLPWACYGIPQRLFLDNAWAHHSYSLEDLARALAGGGRYTQMELVFRPPYQARYGGLIERLFGSVSAQLRERLPGAILSPAQRHWHNASQGACLLYGDVLRFVYQIVVDYLHTPHRELDGLTPHKKWLMGLQLMTPVPPLYTPELERCFWRLHPETRQATPDGLALFGLHYWDVSLGSLRSRDRQGRQRQYFLRYDPLDVSRIAVFENGIWLGDGFARELRLPDGHYESVSLWELSLAKEIARQQNQQRTPRPHSWLIHLLEARELITQRQTEQKLIRRKLQQLRERRQGRPKAVAIEQQQTLTEAQVQATQQALNQISPQDEDPRTQLLKKLKEVL